MIKILCERVSNRSEEYYDYLEEHISNVQKSYDLIRDKLNLSDLDLKQLDNNIKNHDKSKYDDEEFYPYLNHFYPNKAGADNKELYDKAWNKHQKTNQHHWQYWILIRDEGIQELLDMDDIYVIEMLCDWSSFKYKNPQSTAKNWYENNKDKMILSNGTKEKIEYYLSLCTEL